MNKEEQDQLLRNTTMLFLSNVKQVFKDMALADFEVTAKKKPLIAGAEEYPMVVIAHFSGNIQGDFIFTTDEETAAKIAGVYLKNVTRITMMAQRDVYAGLMCEAMNICAHHSIALLEEQFGKLTLFPPAWIYGEYHTVDYISGVGYVTGLCGDIACGLSLSLVGL